MKRISGQTGVFAGLFLFMLLIPLQSASGHDGAGPVAVIDSPADLIAFGRTVTAGNTYAGQTVALACDLDMGGRVLPPIGRADGGDTDHVFQGTFDGGGHRISRLTVVPAEGDAAGFFAALSGASVRDLELDLTVKAGDTFALGGLAGWAEDAGIRHVTVTARLRGSARASPGGETAAVGGLIGRASGQVRLEDCTVTAEAAAVDTADGSLAAGGAIGLLEAERGSLAEDCESMGLMRVTGLRAAAGGFAGGLTGPALLEDCRTGVYLSAGGRLAGAFAGYSDGAGRAVGSRFDRFLADSLLLPAVGKGSLPGLTDRDITG